jgi:tetratricopeptide (TPR) repeat protein
MAQGRWGQCIEALSRGVAAVPKDKDLPLRLAWVLSIAPDEKLRDGARAVKLAETACEGAERKSANVLNILAAAYAEKGDFARAVAAATQAIDVARSEGNEGFAKIIEGRLKLYEEGKPCRPATP